MAKFLLRNCLLVIILLITSQVFAQIKEQFRRTDVVYLKNGSIFRGQIEAYEIDSELKLRIEKNKVLTFKAKNIKKRANKNENDFPMEKHGPSNTAPDRSCVVIPNVEPIGRCPSQFELGRAQC